MSRVTVSRLRRMKQAGEKIVSLTAYDASFAWLIEDAGVEVILVGDPLGMVFQGWDSTIPVTLDDMVYHTRAVSRGTRESLLIADMPFASYGSTEQALASAARLMQEGGAQMVKLEVTGEMTEIVRFLAQRGVPVCAHLGLLPQTVHKLGGYKVQGRGEAGEALIRDALAMEAAGADLIVAELIPVEVAKRLSESVSIPVIGIGAGVDCDGQVLVLYDMLGITPGKRPRFSKDFLQEAGSVSAALRVYVESVKERRFPGPEHRIA